MHEIGETYGNLALFGYVLGGVGRFVFFETFGYERHDKDGNKVAVASADVTCVLVETEIAYILPRICQLRSEKADCPRYLQP